VSIDFDGLAAQLLSRADSVLPAWLPAGKRRGHEFVCGNLQGEAGGSLSINMTTGVWADFATGEAGADFVSLYAAIHHVGQAEAARQLGAEETRNVPRGTSHPIDVEIAPYDAPDPIHPKEWPPPTGVWRYRNATGELLFLVARFDLPNEKKSFMPYTWHGGKWMRKGYPTPRPLYRLPELAASPDLPVLIVEGEKCADAVAPLLPSYAVVTWPHGAKSVRVSDWGALRGREVTIWPDADEPGHNAAAQAAGILLRIAASVRVVRVEGQRESWDAADAIAEGWDTARLTELISHSRLVVPKPPDDAPAADPLTKSAFISWAQLGLDCNSNGAPHANIANVTVILRNHPDFAGKIWFDSFRGRVYHTLRGAAEQWCDRDDGALTVWIQQQLKLSKMSLSTVNQGVMAAAVSVQRNSLTQWLNALQWDGEARLSDWLADYMGVARTPYTIAVSQNWLVSMVARAMQPGCQVDTMPVLEGVMGRGKSSALAVLGGEWYAALPDAFGSKDFLQAIQGTWLVEIPDLAGFSRREHSHIIAIISTRTDRYRAAYGHWTEDHPRQCVFAATSEKDDYLSDSRGIRRYWPLRITHIDLEALAGARGQLFAEAMVRYAEHAGWYDTPKAETQAEQAERRDDDDPWAENVLNYCSRFTEINVGDVLTHCLQIDQGRQSQIEKRRVAKILKEAGWRSLSTTRHNAPIKVWRNPNSPEQGVLQ
jgi:predicted P-loop ATPase